MLSSLGRFLIVDTQDFFLFFCPKPHVQRFLDWDICRKWPPKLEPFTWAIHHGRIASCIWENAEHLYRQTDLQAAQVEFARFKSVLKDVFAIFGPFRKWPMKEQELKTVQASLGWAALRLAVLEQRHNCQTVISDCDRTARHANLRGAKLNLELALRLPTMLSSRQELRARVHLDLATLEFGMGTSLIMVAEELYQSAVHLKYSLSPSVHDVKSAYDFEFMQTLHALPFVIVNFRPIWMRFDTPGNGQRMAQMIATIRERLFTRYGPLENIFPNPSTSKIADVDSREDVILDDIRALREMRDITNHKFLSTYQIHQAQRASNCNLDEEECRRRDVGSFATSRRNGVPLATKKNGAKTADNERQQCARSYSGHEGPAKRQRN